MAIPAQSPVMPHVSGHDPKFRSETSTYSPARTKALLELHGYVDRDGDNGWQARHEFPHPRFAGTAVDCCAPRPASVRNPREAAARGYRMSATTGHRRPAGQLNDDQVETS
jgi:ABC-type transport system substrate-binding protein